ncbi:MAG TPA: 50S ribosomal protein L13 [Methanomicrobiales archaeon]|jgi:large subunit ribosomal protein L13|nr:50S ribosomal protein L13 [Methanomicrobiales archaeon]
MVTIINADGMILGRMASILATRLLAGEEIAVVNAEKAIISGTRARVFSIYRRKRERGSREGGPFFPRRPDHIIKRTIRGMVPYRRERGHDALKRIKVYVGVPKEFLGKETETLEAASVKRLSSPQFVTLGTVSKFLGASFER